MRFCGRCWHGDSEHDEGCPDSEETNMTNIYDHPEMQQLCTEQIQELAALTARQATARIRLALDLRDAEEDGYDVQPAHDRYDR